MFFRSRYIFLNINLDYHPL